MSLRRPLNILLVEGEEAYARYLVRLLGVEGHAVTRAGTIAEAAEVWADGRFDLVIAEDRLPDGRACELLAGAGSCCGVAGILITGDGEDVCGTGPGFRTSLRKPVAAAGLRKAIAQATGE